MHAPPLGPVYPTLHVQFVLAAQPLHEAPEFAAHAAQIVAFVSTEYVPTGHGLHPAYPVGLISPMEM